MYISCCVVQNVSDKNQVAAHSKEIFILQLYNPDVIWQYPCAKEARCTTGVGAWASESAVRMTSCASCWFRRLPLVYNVNLLDGSASPLEGSPVALKAWLIGGILVRRSCGTPHGMR